MSFYGITDVRFYGFCLPIEYITHNRVDNKKWSKTTVLSILQNEKYKGDALLQKQYTVNFLTKKQKKNNGEVPQYYVEGSHEAIIEPEVFDLVQAEIKERKKQGLSNSGNSVFSNRIVCSKCGKFYGPRTFHSTDKYKRVVWQCKSKLKKGHKCETPDLNPKDIENIFIEAFNKLLENKDEVIGGIKEFIKSIDDTEVMEKEKAMLCGESRLIYTKIQNYIDKNATETLNQDTYKENYITLSNEYEAVKQKIEILDSKLKDKRARIISIENFLKDISKNETLIDSFDDKLFIRVIDKIVVKSYTEVIVAFKNGQEVPINIKK